MMCDWLSQQKRNKRIRRKYLHSYKQTLPSFGIGSKLRHSRNQTNIKKKEYKENHLPLTSFTLLKKNGKYIQYKVHGEKQLKWLILPLRYLICRKKT